MDEDKRLAAKEEKRQARKRTRRYMDTHFADGETRAKRSKRTSILGRVIELEEINKEMDEMGEGK